MNDLGRMLAISAAQVTLLASFAAIAYAGVRRRPAAAAQVAATGLIGCGVLTALSLLPLPTWWSWEKALPTPRERGSELSPDIRSTGLDAKSADHGDAAFSFLKFPAVWLWPAHDGAVTVPAASERATRLPALAVVVLATAACGVARLALGLWAVNRVRRAARPLDDPALCALTKSLANGLGCWRSVGLRECPALAGPAVVGWWRPVVLLPVEWRTWDDAERRAVLAHELAHVRRGDFAARVIAGLGVALHFYHPLLHLLASRLRLQQELAADALAASFAGGRASYLRALARLALRLDGAEPAWPAHAFLSSPRTLMRRVEMLRTTDGLKEKRWPPGARLALLAAAVVAASALRGPAREPEDRPVPARAAPAVQAVPAAADNTVSVQEATTGSLVFGVGVNSDVGISGSTVRRQGIDAKYFPLRGQGAFFCRPAELFALPGTDKLAKVVNSAIRDGGTPLGFMSPITLKIEEVEWLTGCVSLKAPHGEGGRAELQMGLWAIRTTRDFDWLGQTKALVPSVETVHEGNATYYRIPKGALPLLGASEIVFSLPDRRTILFDKHLPDAAPDVPTWMANWKSVEACNAACAIDCRGLGWMRGYKGKDKDIDPAFGDATSNAETITFGVDTAGKVTVTATALAGSDEAAGTVYRAANSLLEKLRDEMNRARPHPSSTSPSANDPDRFLSLLSGRSQWSLVSNGKSVLW